MNAAFGEVIMEGIRDIPVVHGRDSSIFAHCFICRRKVKSSEALHNSFCHQGVGVSSNLHKSEPDYERGEKDWPQIRTMILVSRLRRDRQRFNCNQRVEWLKRLTYDVLPHW